MTKKLIVGVMGLAGAGKSTASRLIANKYLIPRRPFAFPLKRMIGALGVGPEILDGPADVKEVPLDVLGGKTARYAMQTLGTEWGRVCMGADFWVNAWKAPIETLPGSVADDCRFMNEVVAIKSLGGIIIKLVRDGSGVKDAAGAAHASEAIDGLPYDYIVSNNGSVEELEASLTRIIDGYLEIQ